MLKQAHKATREEKEKTHASFYRDMQKYFNDVLYLLSKEDTPQPSILIERKLGERRANTPIKKVLLELDYMGLILVSSNTSGKPIYALKESVRNEIAALPLEFENNPYGYFVDKAKRQEDNINSKMWYDTQIAKAQFEDYPTTRSNASWSIRIAIATLVLTVVLEIIKWMSRG